MNDLANGNGISKHDKLMFWGCFIALITTAFAFVSRLFLLGEWGGQFGLDQAQVGELAGIGIWPFALSIIIFSLFIDKIGYKFAMVFSFVGYLVWAVVGVAAYFVADGAAPGSDESNTAYKMLYWGRRHRSKRRDFKRRRAQRQKRKAEERDLQLSNATSRPLVTFRAGTAGAGDNGAGATAASETVLMLQAEHVTTGSGNGGNDVRIQLLFIS